MPLKIMLKQLGLYCKTIEMPSSPVTQFPEVDVYWSAHALDAQLVKYTARASLRNCMGQRGHILHSMVNDPSMIRIPLHKLLSAKLEVNVLRFWNSFIRQMHDSFRRNTANDCGHLRPSSHSLAGPQQGF